VNVEQLGQKLIFTLLLSHLGTYFAFASLGNYTSYAVVGFKDFGALTALQASRSSATAQIVLITDHNRKIGAICHGWGVRAGCLPQCGALFLMSI